MTIEKDVTIVGSVLGLAATAFAGFKYLLQPAYKIEAMRIRAESAESNAHSYERQLDTILRELEVERRGNRELRDQVRASNARVDMLLLWAADRLGWERRGRVEPAPLFPSELEAALYDIAARRINGVAEREGGPEAEPPFEWTA